MSAPCMVNPFRPDMRKIGPVQSALPLWQGLPILAKLWLLVPCRIRAAAYDLCDGFLSRFFAPRTRATGCARKLPFGIYLKASWGLHRAEGHAMYLVRQHTTVPLPTLLDYLIRKTPMGDYIYILMTEIPGETLWHVRESLSSDQVEHIGAELRAHLRQIRQIPNPYSQGICSAAGDTIDAPHLDHHHGIPPMNDVAAFHAYLPTKTTLPHRPQASALVHPMSLKFDNTKPVFAHGDVSDRNILVHEGRLAGVIDWETAGWMPIYWEYVCAINEDWNKSPEFRRIVEIAMPEAYEDERWTLRAIPRLNSRKPLAPRKSIQGRPESRTIYDAVPGSIES